MFSLIILLFLLNNARTQFKRTIPQQKLFMMVVICLFVSLAAETVSIFTDGRTGSSLSIPVNVLSNTVLFLTTPLPVLMWILYADLQIYHDQKRLKRITPALVIVYCANAVMTLMSPLTGWFFYVDAANVYHRGPLFALHPGVLYLLLLYVALMLFVNRKRMNRKSYYTMLFFIVPAFVGSLLQMLFKGLSLTGSGITLSVLLVYFNIQDTNLQTDYLTGAYNRRLLDSIIREKITDSAARTFSVILIDLNNFKQINDAYGHDVGDQALLNTVGLLSSGLREGDIIARYGGDEFMIVLDIADPVLLERTAERLAGHFRRFVGPVANPYDLTFSVGYAVYDPLSFMTADQFIKHVDKLMYQNKHMSRETKEDALKQKEA